MKKIIITCLTLLLAVSIVGCGKKKEESKEFKLRIKESSWSGWSSNYTPEEKTNDYEVEKGKKYTIDSHLEFTITEINKDYIVIETTEAFSEGDKGISLRTDQKEFKIYLDKETRLVTPTMDAGWIYYFTLLNK